MALCQLIAAILGMRLCHATCLGFANEMNFKTVLIVGEPGAEISRVTWTRLISQSQYLTIEAARTLNLFHQE
jgi:hypothetical protein